MNRTNKNGETSGAVEKSEKIEKIEKSEKGEVFDKNEKAGAEKNAELRCGAKVPKHLAVIMDGNGRWAKMRGKPREYGHKAGASAVSKIVDAAFNRGVYALSLYALSSENLSRPEEEVKNLINLLDGGIKKEGKRAAKNGVRFVVSGDIGVLSEKSQKNVLKLQKQTENCTSHLLNICFNYGGRQEICRACNNILQAGEKLVTPETFEKYLYTAEIPDVDLVIRTGGEKRISNFLLWQISYAELYFTDVLWPDFNESELDNALYWFASRSRRFGKV